MSIVIGKKKYLWIAPVMGLLLAIGIFPLAYSILLCFHRYKVGQTGPWTFIGIDNWKWLFSSDNLEFWTSFQTTMLITAVALPLEFLLGTLLALLLSERIRGRAILTTILLIPMMISPICVGLLWRMMLQQSWGIVNYLLSAASLIPPQLAFWPAWTGVTHLALISIILTDVWQWTPFVFLMMRAGMDALPREPFEAAQVDGASMWQTFRHITLRMLSPIILITLLLRGMDLIKIFDIQFILTYGGPGYSTETLSFFAYLTAFRNFNIDYAATASWFIVIIIIIMSNVFVRVFKRMRK